MLTAERCGLQGWGHDKDGAMTLSSADASRSSSPASDGRPLAISLTGLHKNFGHVRAVQGIDLRIVAGEIVALLGPNGAGKTTTIDMILEIGSASCRERV